MTALLPTVGVIGCGYIGLPLAADLVERGHRVLGSTTTPSKTMQLKAAGIESYIFDLSAPDWGEVESLLGADVVVVNVPPGRGDPDRRDAYPRWMKALAARIDADADVIFVSSTSVYPNLNRVVNPEDATSDASSAAYALLEAEKAFADRERPAVVVRFGGLYGYHRHPARFFAGRTDIPGGRDPVNMMHRDDAVGVLRLLVGELPAVAGAVLNACAPRHPSRSEFYGAWAERMGVTRPQFKDDHESFKVVGCTHLDTFGYDFIHPDPMADAP